MVIHDGMHSNDPAVRKRWAEIPCAGEAPTPVELMLYLVEVLQEEGSR